ncbi:carboxypeptidase regulatory-like domain-containing protein [bacterium]|nr:carboxypeptidase regulatory-like domain-containing protein [bacterium]
MKFSHLLLLTAVIMVVSQLTACSALAKIKSSVSGTVYNNGRPMMGQIQLIDPKSNGSMKTEPVNNQGHFIISDVPSGEWLLAFLGPSSAPLGNYKYVKVALGRPVTDIAFEIQEVDPLVQELLDKIAAEKTGGTEKTEEGK